MGLVVLGLKMMEKKELFNSVHTISFQNSQSVDYYVFSTTHMTTLNTAKCGTRKPTNAIIM
jgi:hypothetical protein